MIPYWIALFEWKDLQGNEGHVLHMFDQYRQAKNRAEQFRGYCKTRDLKCHTTISGPFYRQGFQ